MNIGVSVTMSEQVTEVMQIAQRAEALGFDSLWVPEHPMIPVHIPTPFPNSPDGRVPEWYAHWPDPFVALTAVATVTSRLKLATGICLVPEREPLVTAKVVASLDVLSHGRVLLGVGGGALREETEILGTPFGRRWQRLREHVEAMKALWTQEEASYQGEFVRFPAVKSYPKPSQQPHPPVLLGAQRGPRVLARVARYWCCRCGPARVKEHPPWTTWRNSPRWWSRRSRCSARRRTAAWQRMTHEQRRSIGQRVRPSPRTSTERMSKTCAMGTSRCWRGSAPRVARASIPDVSPYHIEARGRSYETRTRARTGSRVVARYPRMTRSCVGLTILACLPCIRALQSLQSVNS